MPVLEYRVVEFDGAAILRAIGAVPSIAEALGLYRGAVERIEFVPERGVIAFTKRGHAAMAEIGAEALGALLVGYCACIKVPLPRRGQKRQRSPHGARCFESQSPIIQKPRICLESSAGLNQRIERRQ